MTANAPLVAHERIAEPIELAKLNLDLTNPRFGDSGRKGWSQTEIVEHIVTTYGVDDVLSSIAVNGYFKAEPLIGRRPADGGVVTIAEGNRRLVDPIRRRQGETVQGSYRAIQKDLAGPRVQTNRPCAGDCVR